MVLHFTCHMLWSTGGPLYTVVSLGAKSRIVIIKVARRANTFPEAMPEIYKVRYSATLARAHVHNFTSQGSRSLRTDKV